MKKEYNDIIKEIINKECFIKTKKDIHHGSTKYDHLLRVSKCSFYISKILKTNTYTTTRAALLHDFFYGSRKEKEENSYLNHPLTAAKNAKIYFNITETEENAIKTHMYHHILIKKIFPFINKKEKVNEKEYKPKTKEGWVVCLSDLIISIIECTSYKLTYTLKLSYLILINIIFLKH